MLELRNIWFSYSVSKVRKFRKTDSKPVLADVSCQLPEGKVLAIIGKSGCGKSSLLNILAGILRPEKGEVFFDNRLIGNEAGIASFMQQNDLLLPHLKIIDNVALPLRIQKISKKIAREKALEFLTRFGLEKVRFDYPSQLSGGMRQRIALMRACITSSKLLLLDEPFSRLDAITKDDCEKWCEKVWKTFDTTVILVTHDVTEALRMADFIAVLDGEPATFTLFSDKETLKEKIQNPDLHPTEALKEYILSFLK